MVFREYRRGISFTKMFYISFFHKLFVTTIFMIILTTSTVGWRMYKMVKEEDKNLSYFEYKSTKLKHYEINMSIDDHYKTIHNLEYKRIPTLKEEYNFDAYLKGINEYCDKEYVTLDCYRRDNEVLLFKIASLKFKTCINGILTDERTKVGVVNALEWSPFDPRANKDSNCGKEIISKVKNVANTLQFSKEFKNDVTRIRDCLRSKRDKSFIDCFNITEYVYTESGQTQKYATNLLKKIEEAPLTDSQYSKFQDCIKTYGGRLKNIFPDESTKKKDVTLKELYLFNSIINYNNSELDDIDMKKLFQNFFELNEVHVTEDDRKKCHTSINEMNLGFYNEIKQCYVLFPRISDLNSYKSYIENRFDRIDALEKKDMRNSRYYDMLRRNTVNITKEYYKGMIGRRALSTEHDYIEYSMRMNIREYLPLPYKLWQQEKETSEFLTRYTDEEFHDDFGDQLPKSS